MSGRKRILFVDDEPNVLQGLQRMLHAMSREWDMAFADGGIRALQIMEGEPFDVIVSDMRMPGMNGAELLGKVMEAHPKTVRLVLSGHADRDLVSQCVGVAHQYISKPCNPEQLKTMVRNACLLSGEFVSEEVKGVVGRIDQLPSVPRLFEEIRRALRDEQVSSQRIGDIVAQDIAMTTKLLKLVNSAFFGLRRTISTPHEAVTYLGVETIKALVLGNSIFGEARPLLTKGLDLDDLWRHSLAVAHDAKVIAVLEKAGKTVEDEAYVGGMLHDIGVLVLAMNFPKQYDRVVELALQEKVGCSTTELSEFGVTHAEVGAYLLGLWGLPPPILKVVSLHHNLFMVHEPGLSPTLAVHCANGLGLDQAHHSLFGISRLDMTAIGHAGMTDRIAVWERALRAPRPE